jgi:hypothetical protein
MFPLQSPAAGRGQRVDAGAPIVFRRDHFGTDVAVQFQTVKRRVQRSLTRIQSVPRDLSNAVGDAPTVIGSERKNLQNQ